jgi:hypothetical protein
MRVVGNLKSHEQSFDFLAFILADSVALALDLNVGWILKEGCSLSSLEDRLEEG